MMKIITFEVSNRSLALTTIKDMGGRWDCSIILSYMHPESGTEIQGEERKCFGGSDDPEAALQQAAELTSACIDNFFPELVEAA